MSGGIAYVLDVDGEFRERCNTELVGFDEITPDDAIELKDLVAEHAERTGLAGGGRSARGLGGAAAAVREGDAPRLQARAHRAGRRATAGQGRGLGGSMGEIGAFLRLHRVGFDKRDPEDRVQDYKQYFSAS